MSGLKRLLDFAWKAVLICGLAFFALLGQGSGQTVATATWNGGSGNWSNANNWTWDNTLCNGTAPGNFSAFDQDGSCYSVDVEIPSGTVTIDIAFTSEINNFTLDSGVLQGGVNPVGNININEGATVKGSMETANGNVTNEGTINGFVEGATITNTGTIVGSVFINGPGSGINAMGGTIEFTSASSSLTGNWTNTGGKLVIDSGATMTCDGTITDGQVNDNGGVLAGAGGGCVFAGVVTSSSLTIGGGTVTATVTGTLTNTGPLTVGVNGTATLNVGNANTGGTLVVQGPISLGSQASSTGQFEVWPKGNATSTGLTIGAAGIGAVYVYQNAVLKTGAISMGSASLESQTNQLIVMGGKVNYTTLNALHTITSGASGVQFYNTITVNLGGQLIGMSNQAPTSSAGVTTGTADNIVFVTVTISGSNSLWNSNSGLTAASGEWFINYGGTLKALCGGCHSSGFSSNDPGASFQVNDDALVTISGAGSTLTATSADIGGTSEGTLIVQSGAQATVSQIDLENYGTLTVSGTSNFGMGSQLTATVYIGGSGLLTVQNYAKLTAEGVVLSSPTSPVTAETGGTIQTPNLLIHGGTVQIQNSGSLGITPGGTISVAGGIGSVKGVLTFSGESSSLLTTGAITVTVNPGGTLQVVGGGAVDFPGTLKFEVFSPHGNQPQGTVNVQDGALNIGNIGALGSQQGWVRVWPGGTIKGGQIEDNTLLNANDAVIVDGNVGNFFGYVSLDPITMNITQNFQQTGGTLDLQIGGSQAGQYDQLMVGGSAQITGGTVEVDFIDGFAPSSGDKFSALSAPGGVSISGTTFTTTGLGSGFTYTTSTSNGQFDLNATSSGTATTSAPPAPPTPTLTSVDAAGGAIPLAPGSLASGYGSALANGQPASGPFPWPATVGGTTASIVDVTGATTQLPLLYVSSGEIDYFIPDTVALGPATVTVTAGDGSKSSGPIDLLPLAPGLFAVNPAGLAAAYADCVSASGAQTNEATYQVSNGAVVAAPLNLAACRETILELWGTGIDGASASTVQVTIGGAAANVLYAGPEGYYPGVDQINIEVRQSLAGTGNVSIVLSAGGLTSNTVNVTIQ
jgi:uncharacterized protein (TIGR03437 family)